MDNIIIILNKLKAGIKLTEDISFLMSYDKNGNSIFDDTEIETLRNDLLEFAAKDNNFDELSHKEAAAFYNWINTDKNACKPADEYSASVELLLGWIKNSAGIIPSIEEELKYYPDYNKLSDVKKEYIKIIAENLKKFDNLSYLETFIDMLKKKSDKNGEPALSDEIIAKKINILKEIMKIPAYSITPPDMDYIMKIDKLPEERINKIIDKYQNLTSNEIALIAAFDKKQFERAEELLQYPLNDYLFGFREIIDFKEDDNFNNAIKILDSGCAFEGHEIAELAQIESNKLDMIKEYLNQDKFSPQELIILSELSEVEFKQAENELFNIKGKDEQLTASQISEIIKLEPGIYMRAKKLLTRDLTLPNGSIRQFNGDEAAAYAGLTPKEFKYALSLYNIKGRDEFLKLEPDAIAAIAVMYTPDINNFIKKYPNFIFIKKNYLTDCITLQATDTKGEKEYVFNKTKGLVEITENIYNQDDNTKKKIVKNTEKNILQEVELKKHYGYDGFIVDSETIKYFDNDGNILRTIQMKQSDYPGIPNISMKDSSGRVVPIQYASVDKHSGTQTISKDFVSPDGTRTNFFYEKTSDNLEILNYKITDKSGNVLMRREQTFQKIDENNFVSSLNGNVYKINFNGNKITIIDNSANKSNTIDLTDKIPENGKKVILQILKHIPGNQLLIMTKLPLNKLEYAEDIYANNNAYWSDDEKAIVLTLNSSKDFSQTLFSTFMHEYGHFIDSDTETFNGKAISDNPELKRVYNRELKAFLQHTTTLQQYYVYYFILNNEFYAPAQERVAETNMLLNTNPCDYLSGRALYFQQYFPRTIAKISELIQKIEAK